MNYTLGEEDIDQIAALLLGHRVVRVDMHEQAMWLDSGTKITVSPNEGGCGCGAGDYELTHLQTVDNIITDVSVINDPSSDEGSGVGYRIFVYADAEQINLMAVDGDDGNGYYGTGYSLTVTLPDLYLITEEP